MAVEMTARRRGSHCGWEKSTDTAGTNVGGVEDVNRYRTRKKKVSTEVQFGVSPLGNREFHTYDKMLHISQAFPA